MLEQVEHLEVDGVRVYAAMDRGNLWCMVRTPDKATFDVQALAVGLKVHTNPAQPAVLDPETQEVTTPAVEASGPLIPAQGVTITEIGDLVLTPTVLDAEGNVTTPAVTDGRFHVNFWLNSGLVAGGLWKQWAVAWTINGQPAVQNNQEQGMAFQGIELIDPTTVTSPSNRML